MGPKNNLAFQSHNYFQRLSKALEFAVSEWLLMFLLFIDACFAYLISKFASYCQLQGPCLLCTRYDHIAAKDKTGIYWDSICNHHKSDISSVVLRHVNENKQYVPRDDDKNLLPTNSIHSDASESLSSNGEHSKNEKNIFVDESLESFKTSHLQKIQISPSSEVEYQKVDVNSDKESEVQVSDNGIAHDLVPEIHLTKSQSDIVPEIHLTNSQTEVPDLHHVLETVATRDTEEHKWQYNENKEDTPSMTQKISIVEETPVDAVLETSEPPRTSEVIKDPIIETEPFTTTNGHQVSNYLELGDAYKLAISTKARQLSGKFLDQKSFKESSTRVNEDLKILLSHRSNDNLISPKLSFNSDELSGIQFLQRRISLERNESNISLDGSIVSEIDGESVVDRLRRQVEHDKKLMGVLYKELEEERNASAVATNQAMAMITRLQEEKAELYTEALQYLRMMEEQAEYNNEALQNANDLIEEKDKQIQDLEDLLRKTSQDVKEDIIVPDIRQAVS